MWPVPKKGDSFKSSSYRYTILQECFSNSLNLLSDRKYGFLKGRSACDLVFFFLIDT